MAGCFGLMSVQLFSSVTLLGLKQVVEEAARPGVSRRSSSLAKSIAVGATLRLLEAELDGPTAQQAGAKPSTRSLRYGAGQGIAKHRMMVQQLSLPPPLRRRIKKLRFRRHP
jgi:hypothetical protein